MLHALKAFLLFSLLLFQENISYAQSPELPDLKINVSAEQMPLTAVLQGITAETGIEFVFDHTLVETLRITCHITSERLDDALTRMLAGSGVSYEVVNSRQVVLVAKKTEQRIDLRGHVLDVDNQEPLPFADIYLDSTYFGATTNANGYFVIVNVPAGKYSMVVEYLGYETKRIKLSLPPSDRYLQVNLTPYMLPGQGITVVDENWEVVKLDKSASELRLSPRQISLLASIGEGDLFRSLQLLPGVSAESDGSSRLFIRGGTPDQNLILLDGMTIYYVDHLFGFLSAFNNRAVKDVRIYKAGYPARYGGRTSAVVEMTGTSGNQRQLRAGVDFNFLSANAYTTIPLRGRGSLFISGRRSYQDIIESSIYNDIVGIFVEQDEASLSSGGSLRRNAMQSSLKFYDINSKLTFTPSSSDVLSLSVYNGEDDLALKQDLGLITDADQEVPLSTFEKIFWTNTGVSGKWSRLWTDRFYTSLLSAYTRYKTDYAEADLFDDPLYTAFDDSSASKNGIKQFTLSVDSEWSLNERHKIALGATVIRSDIDNTKELGENVIFERRVSGNQAAAYMQDEWNWNNRLDVTAGLRAIAFEHRSGLFLEPRLSASYSFRNPFRLKAAWGHYHQFVKHVFSEDKLKRSRDFWLLSDSSVPPEFAEHFVLGIAFESGQYLIDLEGYYKKLDGLTATIENPSVGSLDLDFIHGSGIARGAELTVHRKRGIINGWISYAAGEVSQNFPALNGELNFPAAQDRRHELKVVAKTSWRKWNLSALWIFASGNVFTDILGQYYISLPDGSREQYVAVGDRNAERLPAYHRLDLGLSRRFELKFLRTELGLSIFNVYNRGNIWYRRHDFAHAPIGSTDITTLGFSPNISFKIDLK